MSQFRQGILRRGLESEIRVLFFMCSRLGEIAIPVDRGRPCRSSWSWPLGAPTSGFPEHRSHRQPICASVISGARAGMMATWFTPLRLWCGCIEMRDRPAIALRSTLNSRRRALPEPRKLCNTGRGGSARYGTETWLGS